ncbi:hypothetical protein [Marivivens donghaensis]|uniref:hypothetical protein n=1 Tax=Marivivens donghaensis TaxID=1699413 RepID=UPI00201F8412|nr:hypothetical protein [Marivivens donghaensis]MCL7408177.1 hypothetical protein [Marivivens donghaensis]MDN3703842.1 hypothetical protein [Marivivens donghaensis]
MTERRLFIYKRSFKGNRLRATGNFVARDLREAAATPIWSNKDEHPEKRAPHPWEYSVYYWWWEFLRRHEGYKKCCENGGKGRYASLYKDWGDIHSSPYWEWWSKKVVDEHGDTWMRGEYLFAEPLRSIRVVGENWVDSNQDPYSITINVPLEVGTRDLVAMFRRVLNQHSDKRNAARSVSNALYPVATKVPLRALYWALRAWDVQQETKNQKPKVKNHQKPALMGISLWNLDDEGDRQRARMEFKRYFLAAEDYIACAADEGTFPKRRTKKNSL